VERADRSVIRALGKMPTLYHPNTVNYSSTVESSKHVNTEWRKLHSGDLHRFYLSPNTTRQIKSRRMRWAGHVARMGDERKVSMVLVGKLEGKGPLERPRRRWEDSIRMDLRETGWGGGDGVDSVGLG
jgi:hypothetical protein